MWFFNRKKRQHAAKKEAEALAIRKETIQQIDKRVEILDDINKKMDEIISDNPGISEMIFGATPGGGKMIGNRKKKK